MFKDRFRHWRLSKNLQPDEVLALCRIKLNRDAVGAPLEFYRYGKLVTPAKLERYLCDHPNLQAKLASFVPDEVTTDRLIDNFLPAHHLVALTPCPSKSLSTSTKTDIIESAIFGLSIFQDPDVMWNFEPAPASPRLIYSAFFERHTTMESEEDRQSAWSKVNQACVSMREDVIYTPHEFILQFLRILYSMAAQGDQAALVHQLVSHASELFRLICGDSHPYTILLSRLMDLIPDLSSLKTFRACFSEILIDTITRRIRSSKVGVHYSYRFMSSCYDVSGQRQKLLGDTLKNTSEDTIVEWKDRDDVLSYLAYLQMPRTSDESVQFCLLSELTSFLRQIYRGITRDH